MTNFERITQNEEKLADFLTRTVSCGDCPLLNDDNPCGCNGTYSVCWSAFVTWLRQESE